MADLSILPVADALDFWGSVGLVAVPIVALLVALAFLHWKGQFRGAQEGGRRIADELRGKATSPIASCCPKCGAKQYSKAKDQEGAFIIVYDRICSRCGARYTPPIPRWLCVALIPLGILIAAVGVAFRFFFQLMDLGPIGGFVPIVIVLSGLLVCAIGIGKLRVQSSRSSDGSDQAGSA